MARSTEVHGFYEPHHRTGQREEEAAKIDFEESWLQDIELAYGEMNLLPEQFLEMRPCDWKAKKRGYFKKEEKQWAHTRLIISALTGDAPSKIIPLSFDKPEKVNIPTQEDVKRIQEKYKHHLTPTDEQ